MVDYSSAPKKKLSRPLRGFSHINRYWDRTYELTAAKISPGEYYVTKEDEVVVTVLGSCIAACIRDTVIGVGGMNHFMLPKGVENSATNLNTTATRYGNFAMEALINDILKNGGNKKNIEIKIFGGGKILEHMTGIGDKNISFVHEFIKAEGFSIKAEDIGDTYPRKVYYFPKTGRVRLKKLRSLHNKTILERETNYQNALNDESTDGDIVLF